MPWFDTCSLLMNEANQQIYHTTIASSLKTWEAVCLECVKKNKYEHFSQSLKMGSYRKNLDSLLFFLYKKIDPMLYIFTNNEVITKSNHQTLSNDFSNKITLARSFSTS